MKLIDRGILMYSKQPFEVHQLSLTDLDAILTLQDKVVASLENKAVLAPLTRDNFQYILEGNGLMIGAFVDEQLIAFRALMVPLIDEEHLGRDIGLTEEELASVIYQEISNVHPAYRGNRLQQTLATLIMKEFAKQNKTYAYVCCTVAPFNIPSLKDKLAQGMEIAALKEKYGGKLRYVFVKELKEGRQKTEAAVQTLRMDDTAGQQALLADGWRGFQMANRNGNYWVDFRK